VRGRRDQQSHLDFDHQDGEDVVSVGGFVEIPGVEDEAGGFLVEEGVAACFFEGVHAADAVDADGDEFAVFLVGEWGVVVDHGFVISYLLLVIG